MSRSEKEYATRFRPASAADTEWVEAHLIGEVKVPRMCSVGHSRYRKKDVRSERGEQLRTLVGRKAARLALRGY